MLNEIVSLDRLTYVDQGITYLNQIDLQIYKGEIFGFLSINSQGQNELIELLKRNLPIHYGKISINNNIVNHYQNSDSSLNPEVYVLDRDSKLINGFTVADNFAVFSNKKSPFIVKDTQNEIRFEEESKKLGLDISGSSLVDDLSTYHRYALEIMRAVASGALFIILRDISNYISQNELTSMFALLRKYAKSGISFGYFCNHHEEQFLISDRVSLWEDGNIIKILEPDSYSDKMMLNYSFDFSKLKEYPADETHKGIVDFKNLTTQNLKELTFSIKPGECVTILDQANEIHSDIISIFQGELLPEMGDIYVKDKPVKEKLLDVFYIPEYPMDSSILSELSFMDNLIIPLNRKIPHLWMRSKVRKSIYSEYKDMFEDYIDLESIDHLKPSILYQLIYERAILYNPKVVLIMQPFSNADMYLRQDIIYLINNLKRSKIAVIILAVNLSDSIFVADRLILVNQGRVESVVGQESFNEIMGTIYSDPL